MVLTLSCCNTTVLLSMLLLSLSTTPYILFDRTYLIMLLPHFTYPAVHIASTASTVMTVSLAYERYLAVQDPIVYSQKLRRASAQRRRLAMHVLPVLLFAILFNLPTFWCVENCCDEACNAASKEIPKNEVDQTTFNPNWNQTMASNKEGDDPFVTITSLQSYLSDKSNHNTYQYEDIGDTCIKIGFKFTDFRSHPSFIMFYQNLARLIVLGMMPFALLIFFNCSIYLAIRRRRGTLILINFTLLYFWDYLCRI